MSFLLSTVEVHGGVAYVEGGVCAGETATEAGGTHPTGIHSCSKDGEIMATTSCEQTFHNPNAFSLSTK